MGWLQDVLNRWRRKPAPTPPAPMPPAPMPPDGAPMLEALLFLHNVERRRHGLPTLFLDARLIDAAERFAKTMAQHETLSHTAGNTTLSYRVTWVKYPWSRIGENIAAGQKTERGVLDAWLASPGHRQNILGPYQAAGFGVATSASGKRYWCSVFASPQGSVIAIKHLVCEDFAARVEWQPLGIESK